MYTTIVDMRCVPLREAWTWASCSRRAASQLDYRAKPERKEETWRSEDKMPLHRGQAHLSSAHTHKHTHTPRHTSTLFTQCHDVCVVFQACIKLIRPPCTVNSSTWQDALLPRMCVFVYAYESARWETNPLWWMCVFSAVLMNSPMTVMRWKGCTDRTEAELW